MSKDKSITANSFLQELLHVGLYKRSQGKVARQVTFAAVAVIVALGVWSLSGPLLNRIPVETLWAGYLILGFVLALGTWIDYRLVNLPRFADFLIAVEAEMNKVSWPTRGELVRSSIVVIFVIFSMAAMLFTFDIIWTTVFQFLGVVK
jgi:preprotein translocase subunit SecE